MRPSHIAAAALLLFPCGAWADGISGLVEEEYSRIRSKTTDEAGNATNFDADQLTQRYRLTLERGFFPSLRFTGGGTFERLLGSSSQDAATLDSASRTTSLFATLALSGPVLSGAGGYIRRDELSSTLSTRLVSEDPNFFVSWRPEGLPALSLRLDQPHNYDSAREVQDVTTRQGIFTATWRPERRFDLQYSAFYANPIDRLHDTDTTSIAQTARLLYADSYFDSLASAAAGLTYSTRSFEVSSSGPGGTIATQQFPVVGLSLVELFPALRAQDTLLTTPSLIDGNLTASAGVDLGFAPALAGDKNARDLGVQFVDVQTKVNTLYVWVDRQLPLGVSAALAWTAWQSDDNVRWTELPIIGAVVFGAFQNRFEITIAPTAARYLKVVTKPLDPAVTTNRAFANIFVTELQTLLIESVAGSRGWQSSSRVAWNASFRTQLFDPSLSYDFTVLLTRGNQTGTQAVDTYLVTNGINYSRKLSPILLLGARVARQDQDQSQGHQGLFLYSASLAANELLTLSHSLVYSGQWVTGAGATGTQNSLSLYNRATPFRGVGLLAGAGVSLLRNAVGQTNRSDLFTFALSLQPHAKLSLAGTYGHTETTVSGGGLPRTAAKGDHVDGNVTFTPFPALYLSAGVSRNVTESRAVTLANSALNFSPFPGGDLQFNLSFNESFDPATGVSRLFVPSLRWNIRAGTLLTVTESVLVNGIGAQSTHAQTFDVDLKITL